MSSDTLVLLYLLYGFTFILFGVFAIMGYRRSYSVFPIVNALFYLGIFGITHGVSEWVTMFRHAGAFETYRVELFYFGRILKAVSFLALIQFGMVLILRPLWRKVSLVVLTLCFSLFLIYFYRIVFIMGMDYLYDNPFFLIVTLRYLMALPGAIISMGVLIYHGLKVRNLDKIWMRYYYYLGVVILIYGLLDGFFVRQADFFPANTFHNQWFIETLGIPIQIFKLIAGVGLLVGVHVIIKSFAWEKERKWDSIQEVSNTLIEKDKLKQKIHDDLIQNLYINGLSLETLKNEAQDDDVKQGLDNATTVMNDTIGTLREFIRFSTNRPIPVHDFNQKVLTLIETVSENTEVDFIYHNHLGNQGILNLDPAFLEDVYDVLKELTINVVKHAEASKASIVIYQEFECLKVIVSDDGVGFPRSVPSDEEHLGIPLITSRIQQRGGAIKIHTRRKRFFIPSGTTISALIPLEG